MSIQINKLFRASSRKMVAARANRDLVRKVELARDKAWHDAFLSGGSVG